MDSKSLEGYNHRWRRIASSGESQRNTSELAHFLPTVIALFVVLVSSNVPIKYSISATLLVLSHTLFGAHLYRRFSPNDATYNTIGIGFAIGSLSAIGIDQIFVNTPMRDFTWIFIPLFVLVEFLRKGRPHLPSLRSDDIQLSWLTLLFLMLVGLVQERYWPLMLAICMIPLVVVINSSLQKFRNSIICFSTLLSASSFVYILNNRPALWWIKSGDFQFFESLSYSLAHWGSRDQVFAQGNPILYHWYSFAWTGMISRIIDAPTWLVLTKIGPPIVILILVHLLNELLCRFDLSKVQRIVAIFIMFLLNDLNFESFSMVLSYIYLVGFVTLLIKFFDSRKIPFALLAAFLAAGAFGAKSSNVAVLAGGLLGVTLFGWRQLRDERWKIAIFSISVGLALSLVFFQLYFHSPYGGNIELGVVGLAQDFYGDIDNLPKVDFIVWSLIALANVVALYFVVLGASFRYSHLRKNVAFWFFLGSTPISVIALLISKSVYELEEYFQHSWTMIGSLFLLILVIKMCREASSSGKVLRIVKLTALLILPTVAINFFIHDNNSGSYDAIRIRVVRGSLILELLVVLLIATTVSFFLIKRRQNLDLLLAFLLSATILLSVSLNLRWFTQQQNFRNEVTAPTHEEFMLGSHDVQEISHLVESMTSENALIASNYFCDDEACPEEAYSPHRSNWSVGGEAMFLAVYSHRRFLVSGYGYLWQNVRPTNDVVNRIELSLQFAENPSVKLLDDLLGQDVTYFVVDKQMTKTRNWSQFATTLASNQRFVLLQLKSSK